MDKKNLIIKLFKSLRGELLLRFFYPNLFDKTYETIINLEYTGTPVLNTKLNFSFKILNLIFFNFIKFE